MRVVIVSDLETLGGAAVAASRLAAGLVDAGTEVIRVVAAAGGGRQPWRTVAVGAARGAACGERDTEGVGPLRAWLERRTLRRRFRDAVRDSAPDVINVHNIHAAGWGRDLVEACMDVAPTAWTLHDMWTFSGRCAYSYDCDKFVTGCDATCPTPDEYPALPPSRIAGAWRERHAFFARRPELVAICPSRWLAQTARAGLWRHHHVELIPYGLSLARYAPAERGQARLALGLKADDRVLGFVAHSLTDRRKGGGLLAAALERVRTRSFTLLTAGHGAFAGRAAGAEPLSLGFVEDETKRILAYNACDVMLHPAPVDNLPNVIMEAMACGTPSVGLPVGGVGDLVRPGVTGWLARAATAEALAAAIDTALADLADGRDLRASCREVAEREYDDRLQARRYLALFESMRQSARRPPARRGGEA